MSSRERVEDLEAGPPTFSHVSTNGHRPGSVDRKRVQGGAGSVSKAMKASRQTFSLSLENIMLETNSDLHRPGSVGFLSKIFCCCIPCLPKKDAGQLGEDQNRLGLAKKIVKALHGDVERDIKSNEYNSSGRWRYGKSLDLDRVVSGALAPEEYYTFRVLPLVNFLEAEEEKLRLLARSFRVLSTLAVTGAAIMGALSDEIVPYIPVAIAVGTKLHQLSKVYDFDRRCTCASVSMSYQLVLPLLF